MRNCEGSVPAAPQSRGSLRVVGEPQALAGCPCRRAPLLESEATADGQVADSGETDFGRGCGV
jgi:hypothetical protein